MKQQPDHKLRVYSDITQLIASPENPTPLVKLNHINKNKDFEIYLKLERDNPFGSIKDRIVREMLEGLKTNDKTIIEPSSGNTGIALAGVANARGILTEVAVPELIPDEKKTFLKMLGVNLKEAEDKLCPLFPNEGARGLVKALVESPATKDKYVTLNQYENNLNVRAHYKTTGPEIWNQTKGKITHFFAAYGTCGTITGTGKFLKEKNKDIKIVGIEPTTSEHKLPGMKRITGLSKDLVPKILDKSIIDDSMAVSDEDAYGTAIELARKEGILVGPTTGAILFTALKYAKKNKGITVVISPDDAFKYASFFKEFLEKPSKTKAIKEHDIRDYHCPLSKVKTMEILSEMKTGDSAKIILGDSESLKNVAQELKTRGIKPDFKKENDLFLLTITKP
ncbi:MAG: pyridoxal-phosphate dependent enzyme [Candidatus Aenigmarchaeota archaeon]|nr:pyridoxal-phosphate dependent enzyme [Candidatus Aenigmarchaeota archaeon]